MTIFFVRHGRTTANEKHLYCGQTDVDLSERGVKEILSLKAEGIYPPPSDNMLYYASKLKRTSDTLKLIYGDVKYEALSDLNEVSFGDFEMKSHEDLRDYPGYLDWVDGKFTEFLAPNGETRNDLAVRIENSLKKITSGMKNKNIECAIAFSHGGFIGTFMEIYHGKPKSQYEWLPENGRGFEVQLGKDMRVERYKRI